MFSIFSLPQFLHPVYGGENPCSEERLSWLGRGADWLFDFGQGRYELRPLEGRFIACPSKDLTQVRRHWIEITLKIILIATAVLPLVALACKWIHRSINKIIGTNRPDSIFTAFEAASSIEEKSLKEQAIFRCQMMLYSDDFERRVAMALSHSHSFIKNHELMKLSAEKAAADPERAFTLIDSIDSPEIQYQAAARALSKVLPEHQEKAEVFISSEQEASKRAIYLSLLAASISHKSPARAKQLARQALGLIKNQQVSLRIDACVKMVQFLFKVDEVLGKEATNRVYVDAKSRERPLLRAQALAKLAKSIPDPARAAALVDEAVLEAEEEEDKEFREWTLKKLSKIALPICNDTAIRIIDEKISLPHIRAFSRATAAAFQALQNKERAKELLNLSKTDIASIRVKMLRSAALEKMMPEAAKADPVWALEMMQTLQNGHEKSIAAEAVILERVLTNPREALQLAKEEGGIARDRLYLNIVKKIVDAP